MAVDFGPKQSGWLINQLGVPQFTVTGAARKAEFTGMGQGMGMFTGMGQVPGRERRPNTAVLQSPPPHGGSSAATVGRAAAAPAAAAANRGSAEGSAEQVAAAGPEPPL